MGRISWMWLVLIVASGCGKERSNPRAGADSGVSTAPEPSVIALDMSKRAGSFPVQPALTIRLGKDGAMTLDGHRITADQLPAILRRAHERSEDTRAVLEVDGDTPHGDVIRLIDIVKQSGISEISLGTKLLSPG
jgi:biopolymer transport protein ExbD